MYHSLKKTGTGTPLTALILL